MYDVIKNADEIGNIKPCPFCGNNDIVIRHNIPTRIDINGDPLPSYWEIQCCNCGCLINNNTLLDGLIKRWNTRKER